MHALLTLKKRLTQFGTKDYSTNLFKVEYEVKPMTSSNQ